MEAKKREKQGEVRVYRGERKRERERKKMFCTCLQN
jgi:hypothetical protein